MWYIPIHLSSLEQHINADRQSVFDYMATFGEAGAGSEMSSRVISGDNNGLLVEFNTQFSILSGIRKKIRTVERVALNKPQSIDFEEVEGPFAMRQEHITLSEESGGTHIRYEADIGLSGWVLGWLFGLLYAAPSLKRAVRKYFIEIKRGVETTVDMESVEVAE